MSWYDELATGRSGQLDGNFWMPKAVNKVADDSDLMFYAVLALSAFFFFAIAGAVIYFVVEVPPPPGPQAAAVGRRTTTRSRSRGR